MRRVMPWLCAVVGCAFVACWSSSNRSSPNATTTAPTSETTSGTTTGSPTTAVTTDAAPEPTATGTGTSAIVDAGTAGAAVTMLPLTPGCKRMRQTEVFRCSGVPPGPGESNTTQATACDECLVDGDCKTKAGGKCLQTGGQMCGGPSRFVCKYPDPACGNQICPERYIAPPPSMPPQR